MTETSLLTSFEATSVRCLTRQEESLLQAAVAMVIIKKRFRERKKQRTCRVETLFALPPPATLLPRPLPDHMDHLLQVACRLEGRTLQGVACHLVQQLDAWIMQLAGRTASRQHKVQTHIKPTGSVFVSSKESELNPIHNWMTSSLLSYPQAGSVHRAMILQGKQSKDLLDCWWYVLATLIVQIDEGTLPQSPATSLDHLAVALLEVLQTLATVSSHAPWIPQQLQDLLLPLPTPVQLADLQWTMANAMGTARHKLMLSPGARLLLRLGLCRILLLRPESSKHPSFSNKGNKGHFASRDARITTGRK